MKEPVASEPYACSWCGCRLQWIVTEGKLSILEFESSLKHVCRKRLPRPPYRIKEPVDTLTRIEGLQASFLEDMRQMVANLHSVTEVLSDASDNLAKATAKNLPPIVAARTNLPRRSVPI